MLLNSMWINLAISQTLMAVSVTCEAQKNMQMQSNWCKLVFNQAENVDLAQPHFVLICIQESFMIKRDSHLQQGAQCKVKLKSGRDRP